MIVVRPVPTTLEEAIRFGINIETGAPYDAPCALASSVEPYVRDFLAQRFCLALMTDDKNAGQLEHLYFLITGRRVQG